MGGSECEDAPMPAPAVLLRGNTYRGGEACRGGRAPRATREPRPRARWIVFLFTALDRPGDGLVVNADKKDRLGAERRAPQIDAGRRSRDGGEDG